MAEPSAGAEALMARWLAQLSGVRGASEKTVAAYRRDVSRFLGFMGEHCGGPLGRAALADLSLGDFRAWMASERGRGLSGRSLARALSAVRGFFAWLGEAEGIDCAAVHAARAPKVSAGLPRPVPEADARAVLEIAGEATEPWVAARDVAALTLLWGAGLRVSEALGLLRADAPLGEVIRVTGKGGRLREVPVLPAARAAVARYLALCPHDPGPHGALFLGVRGGPLDGRILRKVMETARRALGLPASATPHALRHAFATQMLAAGGDLRAVQELLGHASLSSTQVYTGVDEARLLSVHAAAHPRARRPGAPGKADGGSDPRTEGTGGETLGGG